MDVGNSLTSTHELVEDRKNMAPHREWDIDCKVYIGGLSEDTNKYDLEDAFGRYGRVKAVWIARRPPGFGFVEMDDPR